MRQPCVIRPRVMCDQAAAQIRQSSHHQNYLHGLAERTGHVRERQRLELLQHPILLQRLVQRGKRADDGGADGARRLSAVAAAAVVVSRAREAVTTQRRRRRRGSASFTTQTPREV